MRTLVIDAATAACSVALVEAGEIIAEAHEVVGRGHAERLLPMIAALPEGGRAGHILVDCGPGSFTGVRVGLAASRALAFGWGATIAGYSSLAIVAAAGFDANPGWTSLAVVLEGGHGEVFMASFDAPPLTLRAPLASLKPEAALAALGALPVIGNGLKWLAALDPAIALVETLPRAANALLLPAALAALPPVPLYGRAPDAKPAAV